MLNADIRIDLSVAETWTFVPFMAIVHLIIPFTDNRQLISLSLSLSLSHSSPLEFCSSVASRTSERTVRRAFISTREMK